MNNNIPLWLQNSEVYQNGENIFDLNNMNIDNLEYIMLTFKM